MRKVILYGVIIGWCLSAAVSEILRLDEEDQP
jgi:hypothetical protein